MPCITSSRLVLAAALICSACAPPEYREAVAPLESPRPDVPEILPVSALRSDAPEGPAPDTEDPRASLQTLSDRGTALSARAEALNTRPPSAVAMPRPTAPAPIAMPPDIDPARSDALRSRADALRNLP